MRNTIIRALLALTLVAAPSGWATIIPIEEAVETVALQVRLSDDLTGQVSGRSCDTCELKRFPVTAETEAYENNQRIDLRKLQDRHGKPATIIYNLRSGKATRILWFR